MTEESDRPLIYQDFYWDLLPNLPKELIVSFLYTKHRAAVLMTSKSNKELVEKAQNNAHDLSFALKITHDLMWFDLLYYEEWRYEELGITGRLDGPRTEDSMAKVTVTTVRRIGPNPKIPIHHRERVQTSIEYEIKASEFESTAYSYLTAFIKMFSGGIRKVSFDNHQSEIPTCPIPPIRNCKDFLFAGTKYRHLVFWLNCLDPRCPPPNRVSCGQSEQPGMFERQIRLPPVMKQAPMILFENGCIPRLVLLDNKSKMIWIKNSLVNPSTLNAVLRKWYRGGMPNLKLMRVKAKGADKMSQILRDIPSDKWSQKLLGPIDPEKYDTLQFSRYVSSGLKGCVRTIKNEDDTMTAGIILDNKMLHFMVVEERTVVDGEIQYTFNDE